MNRRIFKWGILFLAFLRLATLWIPLEASGETEVALKEMQEKREETEGDGTEDVDTVPPSKVQFAYNLLEDLEVITSNETVEVQLKSDDMESGVEKIVYRFILENGQTEDGILEGAEGTLDISCNFAGWIEAYAVDYAGNQSEIERSKKIICENHLPKIRYQVNGTEHGWNTKPVTLQMAIEDTEISSGLYYVKCYVEDELVIHQQYKQSDLKKRVNQQVCVNQNSVLGQGTSILIETMDWAENYEMKMITVYLDEVSPKIHFQGARDGMISGQPVHLLLQASDENGIQSQSLRIWKKAPYGSKELYIEENETSAEWIQTEQGEQRQWTVLLEEDGEYEVSVDVRDLAGHEQGKTQIITIDQTNPMIRYVEQTNGQHIPFFMWNYNVSDMIQDFTSYTYQMTLNGNVYSPGTYVEEEGIHILQVIATDAAGNRSKAEAIFEIDHSAPEILFSNVEDHQTFTEKMELQVDVLGKGERLELVEINGEKKNLTENSQFYSQVIEEPGTYTVSVKAKDLAGNQSQKTMHFQIEKKKLKAVLTDSMKKDGKKNQSSEKKRVSRKKNQVTLEKTVSREDSSKWKQAQAKQMEEEGDKVAHRSGNVVAVTIGTFFLLSLVAAGWIKYRKI